MVNPRITVLIHTARNLKPAIVDGLNIPVTLAYVDTAGNTRSRQFASYALLESWLATSSPDVSEINRIF